MPFILFSFFFVVVVRVVLTFVLRLKGEVLSTGAGAHVGIVLLLSQLLAERVYFTTQGLLGFLLRLYGCSCIASQGVLGLLFSERPGSFRLQLLLGRLLGGCSFSSVPGVCLLGLRCDAFKRGGCRSGCICCLLLHLLHSLLILGSNVLHLVRLFRGSSHEGLLSEVR